MITDSPVSYFKLSDLKSFAEQVFLKIGCNTDDAQLATSVLLKADLRGIDSHGLARLSGYVRLWQKNRINTQPFLKIIHETPSTATLDADSALGLISAPHAMKIAIKKANNCGSGWVAVKNSNHFGIGSYHALLASEQNMIGFAITNASPLVAPTFSAERLLGTNPLCWAFPAGKYPPIVIDMATSTAANGKLEIAQRLNKPIPLGWVQDKMGQVTADAHALKNGGALLPLGSSREMGSHKGFGLSAVVDLLSGVLSGANYGPWVPPFVAFLDPLTPPVGDGIGHFVGALRVDAFRPMEEFICHIDQWIDRFKSAKRIDSEQAVIIPGEPEFACETERNSTGIPLIEAVIVDLKKLGEELGISTDFLCPY